MKVLFFLADAFINTFGITQPSEQTRRKAAFFILILLLLTLAGATVAFFLLHAYME